MADYRASPLLEAKKREVQEQEEEVRAAQAKEAALGYPVSAFPPMPIPSKSLVPRRGYSGANDAGINGGAMSMGMMNPQEWLAQQRAIISMEIKKEAREMENRVIEEMTMRSKTYELELHTARLHGLEEIQRKKEIRMREEMEYHSKVGKKEDILIVTTNRIPGYRIKDVCNTVMGIGLIEIDDEQDTDEEILLAPHLARVDAVEHMVADAQRMHANAIISFQWIIRPLNAQCTKVLAQGTAVIIEKDGPVQCGECGTVKKKQKGEGGGGGGDGGNNQKGNKDHSHDHHSHDHSASSGGPGGSDPSAAANAQKQKQQQQQQQQKGKGGGGGGGGPPSANGSGGNAKNGASQQQNQQQQQQGKKNKGKQNQHQNDQSSSKAGNKGTAFGGDDDQNDNDEEETRSDDDDDDDQSDADDDDNVTNHNHNGGGGKNKQQNQQKGKGQNQGGGGGGGGGGKGGKGQKLTAAQQIVKLLAESKIKEDRQRTQETEKERLYKHMEEFFKQKDSYGGSGGAWGASKKEMTTMDWLKNIEKEIEERNKKKAGTSNSSGFGSGGTSSGANASTGWGDVDDKTSTSALPVTTGWDDGDAKDSSKTDDSNNKGNQKGKSKQGKNDGNGNKQNTATGPGWNLTNDQQGSKRPSPAQDAQPQTAAGWDTPPASQPQSQPAGDNAAWTATGGGGTGTQGDAWNNSASVAAVPSGGVAAGGWN